VEVVCIFSVLIPFSFVLFRWRWHKTRSRHLSYHSFVPHLCFILYSLVAVVLLSKIVDDSLITVWMMMYSCLFCLCSCFSWVVLR